MPPRYDKIAWIDADVWLDNPHWHQQAEAVLEHSPVCQLFSRSVWTDRRGNPVKHMVSSGQRWSGERDARAACDGRISHPGFAWAARRALWQAGGLYDAGVLGSGDTLACHAFLRRTNRPHPIGEQWAKHFQKWSQRVGRWIGQWPDPLAAIPGNAIHAWHGELTDRRYKDRFDFLNGWDPARHLVRNNNGVWQWAARVKKEHPEWIAAVSHYFEQRKEDG